MKKHKYFITHVYKSFPTAISASLMGAGALGFVQAIQPYIAAWIPSWCLPAAQIVLGAFVAWKFGR